MDSKRYLTQSHLSELTGKDRATVRKRLEGLAPYTEHNKIKYFDAHVALPMILLPENTAGIDRQIQEEKLRYDTARADKMELEVAKRRGELIEVESVAKVIEQEYSAVRAALFAIPIKMAMVLAPLTQPTEIKRELEDSINEVLQELSAESKYAEIMPPEPEADEGQQSTSESEPNDQSLQRLGYQRKQLRN